MKRYLGILLVSIFSFATISAQQIMYSSLKDFVQEDGDTVSVLKVQKRSRNQIYLMGGADYQISAIANSSMSRYVKRRCYLVQIDTSLYVNCAKMRYKKYKLGGYFAPAIRIADKVYYSAQPVGQVASASLTSEYNTKLGGEVGDAIAASGLVESRVCYELDLSTGKSSFVSSQRMLELLAHQPQLQADYQAELSERSNVILKYLRLLKP